MCFEQAFQTISCQHELKSNHDRQFRRQMFFFMIFKVFEKSTWCFWKLQNDILWPLFEYVDNIQKKYERKIIELAVNNLHQSQDLNIIPLSLYLRTKREIESKKEDIKTCPSSRWTPVVDTIDVQETDSWSLLIVFQYTWVYFWYIISYIGFGSVYNFKIKGKIISCSSCNPRLRLSTGAPTNTSMELARIHLPRKGRITSLSVNVVTFI